MLLLNHIIIIINLSIIRQFIIIVDYFIGGKQWWFKGN